jgi:prephenate dehydratase
LGDYCFIIDFEGHVADAVVGDCLRDLHAELAGVKFLGSYPAAGPAGPAIRREAETSRRKAGAWVEGLQSEIEPTAGP